MSVKDFYAKQRIAIRIERASERKGYTEENTVEFPVSNKKTKLKKMTLFSSVKASGKVSEKAGIRLASGVVHDISNTMDGTSDTLDVLGPFAFGAPKSDESRLFGAVEEWYSTGKKTSDSDSISATVSRSSPVPTR